MGEAGQEELQTERLLEIWMMTAPVRAWEGVDICSIPEVSAGLQYEVGWAMWQHLDIIYDRKVIPNKMDGKGKKDD